MNILAEGSCGPIHSALANRLDTLLVYVRMWLRVAVTMRCVVLTTWRRVVHADALNAMTTRLVAPAEVIFRNWQ